MTCLHVATDAAAAAAAADAISAARITAISMHTRGGVQMLQKLAPQSALRNRLNYFRGVCQLTSSGSKVRIFVQQLTKFRPTKGVARSLCNRARLLALFPGQPCS